MWWLKSHERKSHSVADIFRQNVMKYPNKACFIFEEREWTFQEVNNMKNKINQRKKLIHCCLKKYNH